MDHCRNIITVIILILSLLLFGRFSWCDNSLLDSNLRPYVSNGGVLLAERDRILYSYHDKDHFCPASILKIATALMTIRQLDESYRFKTEFYSNDEGDLIIRGYGDPFLTSEEWEVIVNRLGETGSLPRRLRELRLDSSSFSPNLQIPGTRNTLNPYDAENGALGSNFNTAYILVDNDGKVSSAEPQTPLTPMAHLSGKGLPPGRHRINMSGKPGASLSYTGELVRAFLEKGGYSFSRDTRIGHVESGDRLIYTHLNARSLKEVISSMMLYSSNYIANQLLLTAGLEMKGEPATIEKGLASIKDFLSGSLGIPNSEFQLFEGSGISRKNRITPRALLEVLRAFYPHRLLLTRESKTGALVKTGTLKDVYSLCGYFEMDRPAYFVILLNQRKNYRDRILYIIYDEWSRLHRAK